jgi:predicted N-formylglutamate amidohydrolase
LKKNPFLLVTCEHGGNDVPPRWKRLVRGPALLTHRGYDLGAAQVARALSRALDTPLFVATTTRLLVDLNRSESHPRIFSKPVRALPADERARIVREHYAPHRAVVEAAVARAARVETVIHVAVHSFTPVLGGEVRRADVGLLYDPRREPERVFCAAWRSAFTALDPALVVRRNYPYRGDADGFTTALRRRYGPASYIGVELELNQRRLAGKSEAARMSRLVVDSLRSAIESYPGRR